MALSSTRSVAPGDTTVGLAANRVATGTRSSQLQRVEGSGESYGVAMQNQWRPHDDNGYGSGHYDDGRQQSQHEWPSYFSRGLIAGDQPPAGQPAPAQPPTLFADILRGVHLYEETLRVVTAHTHPAMASRGQQLNRLY